MRGAADFALSSPGQIKPSFNPLRSLVSLAIDGEALPVREIQLTHYPA